MESHVTADFEVTRILAIIGMLVVGLHALVLGFLAPPLVLYLVPLLFVCCRLLAIRRWAVVVAAALSTLAVMIAAKPLFTGKLSSDWYGSLVPLYLVGGLSYWVPLMLVSICSWRHLRAGL